MKCKEICLKYEKNKKFSKFVGYQTGKKRCSSCEIFIFYDGSNCPCCGSRLRSGPRNKNSKKKLYEKQVFKNFQVKLKLNQKVARSSEKLFEELTKKFSFQFTSLEYIIAISVFLSSRMNEHSISLETISKLFELNEETLEIYCHLALDEIKPNLLNV